MAKLVKAIHFIVQFRWLTTMCLYQTKEKRVRQTLCRYLELVLNVDVQSTLASCLDVKNCQLQNLLSTNLPHVQSLRKGCHVAQTQNGSNKMVGTSHTLNESVCRIASFMTSDVCVITSSEFSVTLFWMTFFTGLILWAYWPSRRAFAVAFARGALVELTRSQSAIFGTSRHLIPPYPRYASARTIHGCLYASFSGALHSCCRQRTIEKRQRIVTSARERAVWVRDSQCGMVV